MIEEADETAKTVVITQRNKFYVGDEIEIMKPSFENVPVQVLRIENIETGQEMESAPHPLQALRVTLSAPAAKGDILRVKEPDETKE